MTRTSPPLLQVVRDGEYLASLEEGFVCAVKSGAAHEPRGQTGCGPGLGSDPGLRVAQARPREGAAGCPLKAPQTGRHPSFGRRG